MFDSCLRLQIKQVISSTVVEYMPSYLGLGYWLIVALFFSFTFVHTILPRKYKVKHEFETRDAHEKWSLQNHESNMRLIHVF